MIIKEFIHLMFVLEKREEHATQIPLYIKI